MGKTKKNSLKNILLFSGLFWVFSGIGDAAYAANLYFSPSSGSHAVGSTFSTVVYVSTADQAMNAASGELSFSSDKLEVTSLLKTGSISVYGCKNRHFPIASAKLILRASRLTPDLKEAMESSLW